MTEKGQQDLLDHIEAIPGVQNDMGKFDKSLEDVFSANFGIQALGAGIEPPAAYCRLFIQVWFIVFNIVVFSFIPAYV